MRNIRYRILLGMFACIFIITSACANNGDLAGTNRNQQDVGSLGLESRILNNRSEAAVVEITSHNGQSYVALNEIAGLLEFNAEWEEATQTVNIGDSDVIYQVAANSKQAKKNEEDVLLAREPILLNGQILLPLESVELFEEYMNYEVDNQQLYLYPDYNNFSDDLHEEEVYFADDPADPARGNEDFEESPLNIEDVPQDEEAEVWSPTSTGDETLSVFTRKNVNANRLIATGKKYLGVKYKFGAKKYRISKRFDCSSFVQQLYNTYGVRLPRVSRNQAKYGISVSRKNLRKGDLLYFYVPGRFKRTKTVGHVGIYIGNGKMLHSSPKPKNGVQISNINKSYWKRTYLGAKRVIK